MKRKSIKKLLATSLAMVMLLTACGQTPSTESSQSTQQPESSAGSESTTEAVASEYPEYLNLDSAYPIIKDEYADDITLKVLIRMQDGAGEFDELWISKYLSEKYNINLEVECTFGSNHEERKSLMFASNELPDILINPRLTTAELVKYGAEEGMLLQLDSYINETLTPNIAKYVVGDAKAACTANDGHMYTLPYMQNTNDPNANVPARMFINSKWLKDLELEMPKTLDDFVDVLYAIKEADPAGVGSENLYPMGGGMDTSSVSWFILNAMGYITYTESPYGETPTLRDGEVVVPVYDMDIYKEYLTLMNRFYVDGIIAPTYFTIDTTEVNAHVINGQTAMYGEAPYLSGTENWADYECLSPLTSKWQTEPEIAMIPAVSVGDFAISADTEYPELCMRIADAFFNNTDDCCLSLTGVTPTDSDLYFDYVLKEFNPETGTVGHDAAKLPEGMASWPYTVQKLMGATWKFGATGLFESYEKLAKELGYSDYKYVTNVEGTNSFRISVEENMMPYQTEGYPTILYATEEVATRQADLETVLHPYIKEQIALFITGKRDLSEVDAFKEELKQMGMDELLAIYTDLYDSYKK